MNKTVRLKFFLILPIILLCGGILFFTFFSDTLETFREIKMVSVMHSQVSGINKKEDFNTYFSDFGISMKNVPENLRQGCLNNFKISSVGDREEITALGEAKDNPSSYSLRLIKLLKNQEIRPITKIWASKYAFHFFTNYKDRSLILSFALKIFLKQNLPLAPLAYADILLLFPEIEKYILDSNKEKRGLEFLKKDLLFILQKIERIPLVNSNFKDLFYYRVYFHYFLFLCEKNKENIEKLKISLDQIIRTSELCLWAEKFQKKESSLWYTLFFKSYVYEISQRLKDYLNLKKNFSQLGLDSFLKEPGEKYFLTSSHTNSLDFLQPIILDLENARTD